MCFEWWDPEQIRCPDAVGLADCLDQQLKGSLHSQGGPDERLSSRMFSSKAWLNLQRAGIRGDAS